jgi:TolB-like protein
MNKGMSGIILGGILFWTFVAGAALAGQVVTDRDRNWAKAALAQEQSVGIAKASGALAVLYFINNTRLSTLDPVQKGLTYMLITDLSKVEGLALVERTKLQALAEEIGLGKSGLVDAETAPRVGRLVGAIHVAGGYFRTSEKEKFAIEPGMLNTSEEKISDLPDSKGVLDEIFRMEKEVLFEILRYLKKTPKTTEMAEVLRKPMTASLEALIFLFKGLNESDQGNYQMAANFYRKSLKADPGLTPAAEALTELESLGLLRGTDTSRPLITQNPNSGASRTENWQNDYSATLRKGKAIHLPSGQPPAVGLAYTPSEAVSLQSAISKALEKEKGSRACECMKIAVDLEYNPYLIIKTIYEVGADLEIDQLCMCATEAGVKKAIAARAAGEALSPLGKPMYSPDEIAQASCFRGEEGLAYTPDAALLNAIPVDTLGNNNYVSNSTP